MAESKITKRELKDPGIHLTSMRAEVTAAHERGERLELVYVHELLKIAREHGAPADAQIVGVEQIKDGATVIGVALELAWNQEAVKNTLELPPAYRYE